MAFLPCVVSNPHEPVIITSKFKLRMYMLKKILNFQSYRPTFNGYVSKEEESERGNTA